MKLQIVQVAYLKAIAQSSHFLYSQLGFAYLKLE